MQDEREYIIKHVFPRTSDDLRERGSRIYGDRSPLGCDCRRSRAGKSAEICLDEIDRCRPYFIGILGERYGWVPNVDDVKKDPELIAIIPGSFLHRKRTSVTEMEMLYGVLEILQWQSRFFFISVTERKRILSSKNRCCSNSQNLIS